MQPIGNITLDLRPGAGNPRNSEGAFLTLPDLSILFVYSKFVGDSSNDDGVAAIASRISGDGGRTWSDDRILFTASDHQARNIMSVSLLAMQNGDIGLFYAIRQGWHDTRLHLRRSSDQGRTWSAAVPCMPCPGYFVTNNDRVIRLAGGRILVPANYHRMKGFDPTDWRSFDGRGMPCLFYSDDDGASWQEGRGTCSTCLPHSQSGLQESGLLERQNGAVWQWMRTDAGCQYEAFSVDGGDNWTIPTPSRFTAPCSPLSMKRMPGSGKLLAVWNPIPNYIGRAIQKAGWGRTPLVLATSADDGATWTEPFVIEDDPAHGYCYTAIHFTADAVLLAYCAGGPEDGICLARTVVRRIPLVQLP